MNYRILSFLLCWAAAAGAQTLPNPGFENWVSIGVACEDPEFWNTPNGGVALFGVCSATRETTDAYSGSASVKLTTILLPVVGIRAPAALSNGILVVNASDPFNSTVQGGSPIWGRPDALIGYYRYEPQGGDSLTIRVRLFDLVGSDTLLIAEDEFFSSAATGSAYELFNLPINYLSSEDADLAQVLIRSTRNTANATVGTTLWLDELRFTGISSAPQQEALPFGFDLYPNPASDWLHLDNSHARLGRAAVFNSAGSLVLEYPLASGANRLDVRELAPGLYTLRLYDTGGRAVGVSRLQILR
jgi:hypothetical protein